MNRFTVFSLLLVVALGTAVAPGATWKQDPAHSQVKFTVQHLVVGEVAGSFKEFDVTLMQTDDDFSGSTLEATIKTASIDTENEGRDKHLRSDDFLNAVKYPLMTFKSTSFEKTGENTYKITGDLTIRDVTKQVVLDAKYSGQVTDPGGNQKVGFRAAVSINRFDFGVKWNKSIDTVGLVAGDIIDIVLQMELQKQK